MTETHPVYMVDHIPLTTGSLRGRGKWDDVRQKVVDAAPDLVQGKFLQIDLPEDRVQAQLTRGAVLRLFKHPTHRAALAAALPDGYLLPDTGFMRVETRRFPDGSRKLFVTLQNFVKLVHGPNLTAEDAA